MKAVGVKVLKAKLSEYIRLVKAGETVLVTERDEVVAELRPVNRQRLPSEDWEQILGDLADEGRVTLRAAEPSSWKGPSDSLSLGGDALEKLLDELRGDR